MTAISVSAALSFAIHASAGCIDPNMLVGIAQRESGLDPLTIHDNVTGQVTRGDTVFSRAVELIGQGHSVDLGLTQINSANLSFLHITVNDVFDPLKSMEASVRLLQTYSRYNTGDPCKGVANGYAVGVWDAVARVRGGSPRPVTAQPSGPPNITLTTQLYSFRNH